MVIIMDPDATAENIKSVISVIHDAGLEAKVMEGAAQQIVGVIGDKRRLGEVNFESMKGVETTVAISKSYKLASREFHPQSSVIDVAGVKIGDGNPVVMSGPCAVESREQLFEAADIVKAAGAQFLRGGAYKPRTSPYSFQGLEEQGLKYLAEARERTGLRVVTEVTTVEAVDRVAAYADMLQVGARNMQNFGLLKAVGKAGKPEEFAKESCGIKAYKKIIDGCIFIKEREIPLNLAGEMGNLQRPLRGQTAQGERIALANSEMAPKGTTCEFTILCLGPTYEGAIFEWLNYGALRGIGQWRNGSYGRFVYEVIE